MSLSVPASGDDGMNRRKLASGSHTRPLQGGVAARRAYDRFYMAAGRARATAPRVFESSEGTSKGRIMKAILIAAGVLVLCTPAQAHRLTGHDYRSTPHWCTWSAATACTRWKARGGKFICPPGSMSVGCQDQRRRERELIAAVVLVLCTPVLQAAEKPWDPRCGDHGPNGECTDPCEGDGPCWLDEKPKPQPVIKIPPLNMAWQCNSSAGSLGSVTQGKCRSAMWRPL
jgi:hypothetical protein